MSTIPTSITSPEDLHAVTTAIAEYLPGWHLAPDDDPDGGIRLTHPTLGCLRVSYNRYAPAPVERVTIHWEDPDADAVPGFLHVRLDRIDRITVGVATGPQKMARQIELRIIARIGDTQATNRDRVVRVREFEQARATLLDDLMGQRPARVPESACHRPAHEPHTGHMTLRPRVWRADSTVTYTVDTEIMCRDLAHGLAVDVKLNGLTPDQARRIAATIAGF